mgnify:CR=1 FL=1
MTTEEKEQYFAQYWGQNVMFHSGAVRMNVDQNSIGYEKGFIELLSTENISDYDAIHVSNIMDSFTATHFLKALSSKEYYIKNIHATAKAFDYLKEKGYALPFRQYSVQDLINEGVLKLKP